MKKILCFVLILVGTASLTKAQGPTCAYSNRVNNEYTCELRNGAIYPQPGQEIYISGELDSGKSVDDVLHAFCNVASEYILNPIFKKFKNLRSLELPFGAIDNFGPEYFNNCGKLEKLVITASDFKTMPAYTFAACSSLKQLIFTSNKITTLNKESFVGLEKLTELRMDDNRLPSLPAGVFDSLVNLKILDLRNNSNLKELPNNVFNSNANLEELYIGNNKFSRLLKQYFQGLKKLTTLDASNCRVYEMESGLFDKLPSLKILKFKWNVCIDEDFYDFKKSNIDEFQSCFYNFDELSTTEVNKVESTTGAIKNEKFCWQKIVCWLLRFFGWKGSCEC